MRNTRHPKGSPLSVSVLGILDKTKVYLFHYQSWILREMRWQSLSESKYLMIQGTSSILVALVTIFGRDNHKHRSEVCPLTHVLSDSKASAGPKPARPNN